MHSRRHPLIALAALAAFFVGVGFFNSIIGVFGLSVAIASLTVFVLCALAVARRRQPEERSP